MKMEAAFFLVILTTASATTSRYYRRKEQRSCVFNCDSNVAYVCGTDGGNYINECALNKAICEDKTGTLAKVNDGLCDFVFGLLRGIVYDPVCANDHKTYSNVVFMDLAACLTKQYKQVKAAGTCSCANHWGRNCNVDVPKCDIGCPAVYDPVCASDGQVYVNECALEKQNCILGGKALTKLYNGICEAGYGIVIGIEPYGPVCASDGKTYSSKAFVDVARCQNFSLRIVSCH